MIKLLVKDGDEFRELECSDDQITIGRSSGNTIALKDKKSSRKHAKLEKTPDGGYRAVDLESGNGTRVNGQEVTSHVLSRGDEIKIGLTTITVLAVNGPAPVAAPAPAPAPAAPPPAPAAAPAPVALAAPPAPAPAPAAPDPAKATRRTVDALQRHSFNSTINSFIRVAAALLVLGALVYGAMYVVEHNAKPGPDASKRPAAGKPGATLAEAEAALAELQKKVASSPPTKELMDEAREQNRRFAEVYRGKSSPFDKVLDDLFTRQMEQAKENVAEVSTVVDTALRERRYGVALDQLKRMKASTDPAVKNQIATLIEKVDAEVKKDFAAVDSEGKKLESQKKYEDAKAHYAAAAPRFQGTEHYKYMANKPEIMEMLAKAAAENAAKPAETPVEPPKPADTQIAKAPPKEGPAEPPKEGVAEPPKEAPKAMPKEPPKSMPKEPPKPPPATPKPPAEPPKPKEAAKPPDAPKPEIPKDVKNPCDCKKIVKGVWCPKCQRVLEVDDVRRGVCKKCEEKPKKIELCVKKYYQAECHPEKISDRPISCDGKLYDLPLEDKAKIIYQCSSCEEAGDTQGEIKHKDDCKNRLGVKKICTKSGTGPHQG